MNTEELLKQAELAKIKVINEIVRRRKLNQPIGALHLIAKAYDRDIKTYRKMLKK